MNNILDKIIRKKIEKIEEVKKNVSLDLLKDKIAKNDSFLNFKEKIFNNVKNNKISIIAEIKKASPSAGIIIENYDPLKIAEIYLSKKTTCLSVLTEEDFFLGNLLHISNIKKKVNLPVLCKDFFIDKYQVPLAKSYGSDAILLILAALNNQEAREIYDEATKYNMSVIVEVHTIEEAKRALSFENAIIGINNRNLKTLVTDIKTTYDIYNIVKNHSEPIIAESGIKSKDQILEIEKNTKIKTFLIGESLLKDLEKNSIFSLL